MEFFKYFLGVTFILGGVMHFIKPKFYLKIMPSFLPFSLLLIYLSGFTEIISGVLLLFFATQKIGAILIILQLFVFLIIHINMLVNEKESLEINKNLLWVRLLLQFGLIYLATLYL
ncbi:MAG: MauE/DoxX family redox-associated membrane protein [Solirubrobacteraceae bacterium]